MKALSHEIGSIFELELSQDVDVITCLDNLVKTCQNIMWLCDYRQKADTHTEFFLILNYKTSPSIEGLNSSLAQSAGAL